MTRFDLKTFTMKYYFLFILIAANSFFSTSMAQNSLPPGYPDRSPNLDVLPGFKTPPPGYGEVPFWWWTGEDLNVDRMIWQVRELHKKGISGVQVNYSHFDTPGWLSDQETPNMFTDEWWDVYSKISEECTRLNMGIGMSTYTIDWPQGAPNLFYQLFYRKPELNAYEIRQGVSKRVKNKKKVSLSLTVDPVDFVASKWADAKDESKVIPRLVAVWAYPVQNGRLQRGGIDLTKHVVANELKWTAPKGEWEIREYLSVRKPGSMNPLLPHAGETIINSYYQQFQNHAPGQSSKGLNYFFNDELHIGLGKFAWSIDFAKEFSKRKGYNLFEVLPAMWEDIGDITPKVRIDYADVRMAMMEERYFKPIYDWHASRGMIFACDPGSRGLDPHEFGDYFRAIRWYSAPGHDTPGGKADLIKGKVSSSIANLYQRPRVWLEGYHSLGWGATPELLMFATRENYLYGCNLLNLHGLYYTTYGSYWEWAPPCYHFRMPYWNHMDVFLRYFDRLSYLMSQGYQVCDVAVIYPVTPYEAELGGDEARDTAFELGRNLMAAGINFEFIDHESLAHAVVEDGQLKVKYAGASYKALVFPNMNAVRWQSIEKAAEFAQAGGNVYVIGAMPSVTDRIGANDIELNKLNNIAFAPSRRYANTTQTVEAIKNAFVQDVKGINQTVRALHRKAGYRDIYLVMDSEPGTVVEFRAKGAVELWDPWTGATSPLRVTGETVTGTLVELPLKAYEANIVVFDPKKQHANPQNDREKVLHELILPDEWNVSFIPTMDNTYGDFRLPVTEDNKIIGVEARRFTWMPENKEIAKNAMLPTTDDNQWQQKLNDFGTQFYLLGPIPQNVNINSLEIELSQLKSVNPSEPIIVEGKTYNWQPYDFSWRWGKEGDPGHQGYHGLKRTVTDDFLCIGKMQTALNETRYVNEIEGGRYFIWSNIIIHQDVTADILYSKEPPLNKSHTSPVLTPAVLYLNGKEVKQMTDINLAKGSIPLLVRYDHAGRGHLVFRDKSVQIPAEKQHLSMRWANDSGVIPFDVTVGEKPAEWFRFITAPGTSAIKITARGEVEAWIDGKPMKEEDNNRFSISKPFTKLTTIALRITPASAGITGGSLIPEPIVVETTDNGMMPLGDWSTYGILNNYSGGVLYKTSTHLEDINHKTIIDLGKVAGTAEIIVNGQKAGIRVAPPWKQDITKYVKKGDNKIEILVFNSLANHYQTLPSNYRGNPSSGLIGPVKVLTMVNNF